MAEKVEPKANVISEAMLRRAVAGNREAFAAVFDAHYDFIYRVAYKFTQNPSDAEDVTQDTCLKLAKAISGYRFEASFTTWLFRLTANTAMDWHRKAYRKRELDWPTEFDPAVSTPSPEKRALTRELLRMIETLPTKLKNAVLLVFRDGLSHRQAAEELGCAESTVSWRVHKARKVLSRMIDTQEHEGSHHA